MIETISILNALMAFYRFLYTLKSQRFICIVWFLILYFSIFFIPTSFNSSLVHFRGFTGETIHINRQSIEKSILFVASFNFLFLIGDLFFSKIILNSNTRTSLMKSEVLKSDYCTRLQIVFGFLLLLGTIVYGITTKDQTYRDFVEFKGSNWGQVLLMAGAPFIAVMAMRGRYISSLIACVPFLYFAMKLHIRSFALLSLIPVIFIYVLDKFSEKSIFKLIFTWRMFGVLIFSSLALLTSMSILSDKGGHNNMAEVQIFPDSGMPYGTVIIMELIDRYRIPHTDFDALALHVSYILNPFRKLLGLAPPAIVDPPVIMANIYEGIRHNTSKYYHYPALWYTDAYLAFGIFGLWLAFFWGFIFVFIERILMRNPLIFLLLIPSVCWYVYMVIRGAIAGAAVPFSYSVYISVIAAFLTSPISFIKAIKS